MSRVTPIITDFTRGELSPLMGGRVDRQEYFRGVAELQNFIVIPQGGATLRPGLRFLAEVADSSKKGRLVPYVINESTRYMLEFHDGGIRVSKGDSTLGSYQLQQQTMTADVSCTNWVAGAYITGQTSGATARIIKKNSATSFIIAEVTGTFTDGEVIADDAGTPNSYDLGAGYPQLATAVPLQVVTEDSSTFYSEAQLPRLKFRLVSNRMYLVHYQHPPKLLAWLSDGYWKLSTLTIDVVDWAGG